MEMIVKDFINLLFKRITLAALCSLVNFGINKSITYVRNMKKGQSVL